MPNLLDSNGSAELVVLGLREILDHRGHVETADERDPRGVERRSLGEDLREVGVVLDFLRIDVAQVRALRDDLGRGDLRIEVGPACRRAGDVIGEYRDLIEGTLT